MSPSCLSRWLIWRQKPFLSEVEALMLVSFSSPPPPFPTFYSTAFIGEAKRWLQFQKYCRSSSPPPFPFQLLHLYGRSVFVFFKKADVLFSLLSSPFSSSSFARKQLRFFPKMLGFFFPSISLPFQAVHLHVRNMLFFRKTKAVSPYSSNPDSMRSVVPTTLEFSFIPFLPLCMGETCSSFQRH